MDKLNFISLYSGCGGMDAGFLRAGYNCLRAFDIDKLAVKIHNKNNGDSAVTLDLQEASINDLLANGTPEVVLAGSPCQGFSTAGKRNFDDPRNSLLSLAGDLAIKVRPKVFIAENVSGVLAGSHRQYWDKLISKLRLKGYSTKTVTLDAVELGLPQRRRRVILVAWRGDSNPNFNTYNSNYSTLRNAFLNIDKVPQHNKTFLTTGSKDFLIAQKIRPGQKLSNVRGGANSIHSWDIPEVFGHTNEIEKIVLITTMVLRRKERVREFGDADPVSIKSLERELGSATPQNVYQLIKKGYMREIGSKVDLVNTFNGKYRRLAWDSVSLTVDTRFGDPRYFLHPEENRGFTVREAARIQGFSDDFVFSGNEKKDYKMIGNAVPPPMGEFIGNCVRYLLLKN